MIELGPVFVIYVAILSVATGLAINLSLKSIRRFKSNMVSSQELLARTKTLFGTDREEVGAGREKQLEQLQEQIDHLAELHATLRKETLLHAGQFDLLNQRLNDLVDIHLGAIDENEIQGLREKHEEELKALRERYYTVSESVTTLKIKQDKIRKELERHSCELDTLIALYRDPSEIPRSLSQEPD